MSSKVLCTDVLSIRCIREYVLVGVGYMLHIYDKDAYKLIGKLNCLYPYNIHGIVNDVNNKLAIFGARSLCICNIDFKTATLKEKEFAHQFDDWIIAIKWLSFDRGRKLAILFAHNKLCIYNVNEQEEHNFFCEEKCILYGGSISGETILDCVIFSGTVFQEILIWKPTCNSTSNKDIPVLHRLLGHNGVIFSVIYDPATNIICSTSDDRTVRLWTITNRNIESTKKFDWENVDVALSKTMFGHSARVWRVIVRDETLVTVGEDSLVCMWSLAGELIKKIYAHQGAAIWSVDVSEDNKTIFTGGAGGALYAIPFQCPSDPNVISLIKSSDHDCPKHICYLKSGSVLVFNEGGTVLCYSKNEHIVRECLYLEKCSTYCIMDHSPCRSYICFGSRDGYVSIYKENDDTFHKLSLVLEAKLMDSQIFSLHWLEDDKMLVCGSHGLLKLMAIDLKGMAIQTTSEFELPSSRERWVTAAIIFKNFLICGDRAGSIYVFDPHESIISVKSKEPVQSLTKVHGKIGVQSFTTLENKLITTGRDGMIRYYEFSKNDKHMYLHPLYSIKMPMDWICGTRKVFDDMLVLGFKEIEFVIFSTLHKKVVTEIPCGGGHRSWDCIILDESINFAYIRNKQAYTLNYSLHTQLSLPRLQNGFHNKEINCMQALLTLNDYSILLSGSEDCTLRVNYISKTERNNYTFCTLNTLDGHLSSIKSIAIVKLQETMLISEYLIFSGGGRAQLKIWKIRISPNEGNFCKVNVSCSDMKSHMLHGLDQRRKKPWQEKRPYDSEPETRYMDINATYTPRRDLNRAFVFIGCADGYVRIFLYDLAKNSVYLKGCVKCASRCILKIHVLQCNEKIFLLTMATDGFVRFFDFTDALQQISDTSGCEIHDLAVFCLEALQLHQSGINCFDCKSLNDNKHALITGGDDNLISFIIFKVSVRKNEPEQYISIVSKWSSTLIHAAQITGVKFVGENEIISVGLDQQIIKYSYEFVDDALSVKLGSKSFTCVTDAQGMFVCPVERNEGIAVSIYGKGFEILSLTNDE